MNGGNGRGQICAICYYIRDGDERPADLTINGQSLCLEHIGYVQGGSFAVALNLARSHEAERARHDGD